MMTRRSIFLIASLFAALTALGQVLQPVYLGTAANDKTGDPIRTAFEKLNSNDSFLWSQAFDTLPALLGGKLDVGDGLRGDISITASGSLWEIAPGAVGLPELGGSITAAGKALLDDATASDQRVTLGLGPLSTLSSVSYSLIQPVSAPSRILGRGDASAGVIQELSIGAGLQMIGTTLSTTGTGALTNESSITVANVAAMLALSQAQLTNGPVSIRTLSRTANGIGGSVFRYDSASTATTNLGSVFTYSAGGRFLCIDAEPGNVELYGADPLSASDSLAALNSAGAYAKASGCRVWFPGKTFYTKSWYPPTGIKVQLSKATVIKAFEYPPFPGGSQSAQTNLVYGTINLLDGTDLDMGGAEIDSRWGTGAFVATSFKMATITSYGTTNISIRNGKISNPWNNSIHLRYCTNFIVSDCSTVWGPGPIQAYRCQSGLFQRMRSDRQQLVDAGQNQHLLDFQGNKYMRVSDWFIQAPLGVVGKSYVISGFTIGGDDGDDFSGIVFEPMDPNSDINAAAMLLDGCHRTTFRDSIIDGWNIGQSIPIEIAAPRSVTIRRVVMTGARVTDKLATIGGAGIYGVEGGIFGMDSDNWKWNEGGWQFRTRSNGSDLLIDDCDISGFYIGVELGTSYTTVRNCRIIGNISAGIKVGRNGVWGTDEIGWMNTQLHRFVGNIIEDSTITHNGDDGIRLDSFEKLTVRNNKIANNDQNERGAGGIANLTTQKSVNATGTTATDIVLNATSSVNQYRGQVVYYNGEYSKIIYNSTSTLYCSPAFSTIPSGNVFIVPGPQGDIYLKDNFIGDDQALTMTNAFSLDPTQPQTTTISSQTTTTGSTTSVINSTTGTMVVNEYANRLLYVPSTGETCKILSNTASTFTLSGTIAAPGAGVSIRVIPVPSYRLSCAVSEELHPGQRVLLKGVQTGGVDLFVNVRHWDWKNPDELFVEPVGTTSVTSFLLLGWQQTVAGAIVAGSGTLTFNYQGTNYYGPSGALLAGASGNIESQIDGPYWIGVDPGTGTYEWRAVRRTGTFAGATNGFYINEPFSQTFPATAFRISKFNGVSVATQSFALKAANSAMRVHWLGDENDLSGNSNPAIFSISAAPDAQYPRITVDSATPTIPGRGNKFCVANTTGVTITSMAGGWEGRKVSLFYLSGSAPTIDCTSNPNIVADGVDHTLTVGSWVEMTYSNGKWLCQFVTP